MVWDQASSGTAHGEVLMAAKAGHAIAEGLAVDAEGHPTTDPNAVLKGGAMLPFAGHKGSAIALMVEIMAAALTGGRFGFEDHSVDFPGAETSNAGELIILIDPRHFAGADFAERAAGELWTRPPIPETQPAQAPPPTLTSPPAQAASPTPPALMR